MALLVKTDGTEPEAVGLELAEGFEELPAKKINACDEETCNFVAFTDYKPMH